MYRGHLIAVVLPAYNVRHHLRQAVATVPRFVDRVVVVDDASDDGTAETVTDLLAERDGASLIRHGRNRGVGGAIATGYRAALDDGAEIVAVMAGDGQMDPEDLPRLLDPVVEQRADYAKGNRFRHDEVWRAMPKARIFGNLVLTMLTKVSSGYWGVFDSQCGYTAASRATLEALEGQVFDRYGYLNDQLARLHAVGARLAHVPVRPIYAGEPSGIRLSTVLHPILSVLLGSFARRLWVQYLRPLGRLERPGLTPAGHRLARARAARALTARDADRPADHLLPAPRQ